MSTTTTQARHQAGLYRETGTPVAVSIVVSLCDQLDTLVLAFETERDAANLYAKQVAHWIEKYDAVLVEAKRFRALHDMECAMCPPDSLSYYINNYEELDKYIAFMSESSAKEVT